MKKNFDSILEVSAIVLANLCVSYIMTSQNEEAEELMRKIEKEQFNSVNFKMGTTTWSKITVLTSLRNLNDIYWLFPPKSLFEHKIPTPSLSYFIEIIFKTGGGGSFSLWSC